MEGKFVRVLLDTHTIIWALCDDPRLGEVARNYIKKGNRETLAIADITLLEISMLVAKGRIEFSFGVEKTLETIAKKTTTLPITPKIATEAMALEIPQADPFDRIIVATAIQHLIPLLTRDRAIAESGQVEVIW